MVYQIFHFLRLEVKERKNNNTMKDKIIFFDRALATGGLALKKMASKSLLPSQTSYPKNL